MHTTVIDYFVWPDEDLPEPLDPTCPAALSPWTPAQIEALCGSIQHWYENWQEPRLGTSYSSACDCCNLVRLHGVIQCKNCPIGITTKLESCDGTPWFAADLAISDARHGRRYKRRLIEKEYAFLCSILFAQQE